MCHSIERKKVIVESIFKIWLAIFGSPNSFLVDNVSEYINSEFISFCENFNINTKTTAAESPRSNGLVEHHNGILDNTVRKMVSDKPNYSVETGVAWAIATKNSLKNVYGFSPNQLVFGKNLNFPNVESNKLPALKSVTCSKIVAENLSAMHDAR